MPPPSNDQIILPVRAFYFLLIAPIFAIVGISLVWSAQVNNVRDRVREENAAHQLVISKLIDSRVVTPIPEKPSQ